MSATLEARSPAWHADRRTTIGASDAPIITGDAPWGDLLTLFAVKTGLIDSDARENQQTQWGLRLEDVVADWFSETTGKKLRRDNRRPRHPKYEWMATSLDRRVVGEPALVEIKTARYANDEWGAEGTAEIPAHYLVQVQHELAVTGAERCYVAVLFAGSDPRMYEVPRDEELIESLIALEAEFMECVRNGTPPEQMIAKRQPVVKYRDGEIEADEVLAAGIEGVWNLRQEIKQRLADLEPAEWALKTLIGENTAARAGDFRATYKPSADSHPIRWELVAKAYRKWIEDLDNAMFGVRNGEITLPLRPDLDAIESIFTDFRAGARPLRITRKAEALDA